MDKYELTIAILDAEDSIINTLVKFIPKLEQQIYSFERRKVYIITND